MAQMSAADFEQKLRNAFDAADTNKNGVMEEEEAHVLAKLIYQKNGQEFSYEKFKKNFDLADVDKDGMLTFVEFRDRAMAAAREKGLIAEE